MLDPNSMLSKQTKPLRATSCKQPVLDTVRHVGTHFSQNYGVSDGSMLSVTTKTRHVLAGPCRDISPVHSNTYASITAPYDIPGPSDITLKVAIEYNEVIYPLTFDGNDSIVLKPRGVAISDPLAIYFPKGAIIYIRSYAQIPSGGKYPTARYTYSSLGEGCSPTDKTIPGSGNVTLGQYFGFIPNGIIGCTSSDSRSILLMGDSIMAGVADTSGMGYMGLALDGIINWCKYALSGERASNLLTVMPYRFQFAKYFSHCVVGHGVNDVNEGQSFNQIQASLMNLWQQYSARGCKVYQTTLTPKTLNDTTVASVPANEVRIAVNNWIRSKPAPLLDYIEVADNVETARDSGLWRAGYSTDRLHPNTLGHTELSKTIDLNIFN